MDEKEEDDDDDGGCDVTVMVIVVFFEVLYERFYDRIKFPWLHDLFMGFSRW